MHQHPDFTSDRARGIRVQLIMQKWQKVFLFFITDLKVSLQLQNTSKKTCMTPYQERSTQVLKYLF